MNRDIVLFLGAGFSAGADLPTMYKFGEKSDQAYKRLIEKHYQHPRESKNFRKASPKLVDAAEKFQLIQNYIKKNRITDIDPNNMEDVFSIIDILKTIGITEIELNSQKYSTDQLIKDIQIWLWKIYQMCPPVDNTVMTDKYNGFFKILKDNNIFEKISVVTTNYDLIFEYISNLNDIKCFYGISENNSLEINGNNNQFISEHSNDSIPIFKLHGSINFFYIRAKKQEQEIDDPNRVKYRFFISKELGLKNKHVGNTPSYFENAPIIFALDSIWSIWTRYGDDAFPAIIPPTYSKLKEEDWLQNTWHNSHKAIANANKIIFIGYRFPESDGFMKSFFNAALSARTSLKKLDILVINPNDCDKYKQIFKKECNIQYCKNEMFDAIDDIRNFLHKTNL